MKKIIDRLDHLLKGRQTIPSSCLTDNSDVDVYIEDSKVHKKCVFAIAPEPAYADQNCFKITNQNNKTVFLWAIDGCFVADGKPLSVSFPMKCDCMFGCENYLGFVEFKLDANPLANPKTIAENRETAVEQIEHTIGFLKDALNISGLFKVQGYVIEAFICTPVHYPSKNTAIADLALAFLEDYGVPLFEANHKEVP
jgi:hypothetical protein